MTSLTVFPKLRRTLTDVMEDELYHVPNSPYTHSNNSNTSMSSIRHDTLLTIPDFPESQSQSQSYTYSNSPQLSQVPSNDHTMMTFNDQDVPVFTSYADPDSVPFTQPQLYENEPLVKFNDDLTLSLFDESDGLVMWPQELHVAAQQAEPQAWNEELEEMLSDSEDEYFDTDWEEEYEGVAGPRFGELRRESMSAPCAIRSGRMSITGSAGNVPQLASQQASSFQMNMVKSAPTAVAGNFGVTAPVPIDTVNASTTSPANLMNTTIPKAQKPTVTDNANINTSSRPATVSKLTPNPNGVAKQSNTNQRADLSSLVPNAQGLHQCQLLNPQTNEPCLKSFSRPYDLIRHQDTIHAERKKIFRCIVCCGLYPHALYPDRPRQDDDVEMMDVDPSTSTTSNLRSKKEKTFSRGDALSRHVRVKHELSGEDATRAIQWAKDNVEYA